MTLGPKADDLRSPNAEEEKEKREAPAAIGQLVKEVMLSDQEWLLQIALAKYPDWPLADLVSQWKAHGAKGEKTRLWVKGDRGHFLKAWMPHANKPYRAKRSHSKTIEAPLPPPEDVDPKKHTRFMEQFAAHKKRRSSPAASAPDDPAA